MMTIMLILAFAFYYQLPRPFDDDEADDDHLNVDNDDMCIHIKYRKHQKPYTQVMPHLLKVDIDVDECGIDCGFYKGIISNQFL